MIQSMTGFGSAEEEGFRIELRSLNHRFIDIHIKLPPALSSHEMQLRETLKTRFGRGKIDAYLAFMGEAGTKLTPDLSMAREVVVVLNGLKEKLSLPGEVDLNALLQWKEALIQEEVEYDVEALHRTFGKAVDEMERMRLSEGETLVADIVNRMEAIAKLTESIMEISPEIMETSRRKFKEKLGELLVDMGCDDAKLLQEAASIAEKSDVTEELVRLKGHIEHMEKILKEGGVIGRKLDFLAQELNREANTVASKSDDYRILEKAILMRAEIERLREQVQNIQ